MRNWLGLVLIAWGVGCTAHYPEAPTPTPSLAAIRIHYVSPHTSIGPGSTVSLTLYAISSEGVYEVVTSRASWFSANPAIASVTNGVARGVAPGSTDVVASYEGRTSTARIVVDSTGRFPVLAIRLVSSVETGRTIAISALFSQTANSASRDVRAEAVWTSSDPSVFTVEAGQVTFQGPGTAVISASFNGVFATTYMSVPPIRSLP